MKQTKLINGIIYLLCVCENGKVGWQVEVDIGEVVTRLYMARPRTLLYSYVPAH